MSAMHTPGPWIVTRDFQVRVERTDIAGLPYSAEEIADCSVADNRSANAALIAAAPDLLEMLEHYVACSDIVGWTREEAKELIAKARGAK